MPVDWDDYAAVDKPPAAATDWDQFEPIGGVPPVPDTGTAEEAGAKILSPLDTISSGFSNFAKGAGNLLKDLTSAYAFEAVGDPEDQAKQLGVSDKAIKQSGLLTEPSTIGESPIDQGMKALPVAGQLLSKGAYGLVDTVPQLGAVAAAQALGIPAPLAAAGVFGSTPEGFDPKQAAIAAALPFVGKYSGEIAGAVAKKFGVPTVKALDLIKQAGGLAGAAGYLGTIDESEIANLPPEQQTQARIDAVAGLIGQSVLGPIGVEKTNPAEAAAMELIRASKNLPLPETTAEFERNNPALFNKKNLETPNENETKTSVNEPPGGDGGQGNQGPDNQIEPGGQAQPTPGLDASGNQPASARIPSATPGSPVPLTQADYEEILQRQNAASPENGGQPGGGGADQPIRQSQGTAPSQDAGSPPAETGSEVPIEGEPNASQIQETAAVHGDVQPQPGESQGQVPTQEGSGGIQPSAQSAPREVSLSDYDQYQAVTKNLAGILTEIKAAPPEQKMALFDKFTAAQKELETIKNRNQGMPPTVPESLEKIAASAAAGGRDKGYVPAIKKANGEVVPGLPGETHPEIRDRAGIKEAHARGYVKDGKFYNSLTEIAREKMGTIQTPVNEAMPVPPVKEVPKEASFSAKGAAVEYAVNQKILDTGQYPTGKKVTAKQREELQSRQKQVGANYETALKKNVAKKSTPDTPAAIESKVQDHVTDTVKTEGVRPAKEIKSELVERLQKAVGDAPSENDLPEKQRAALDEANKMRVKQGEFAPSINEQFKMATDAITKTGLKKITIQIPGDGTFNVWNTKEAIQKVLDRAKKLDTSSTKEPDVLRRGIGKEAQEFVKTKKQTISQPAIIPQADPIMQSLGGMNPADPLEAGPSDLAQLSEAIRGLADKPKSSPAKAFGLGESFSTAKDKAADAILGLKAAGAYLKTKLEGKPIWTKFKEAIGDRHLALSESALDARKFAADALKKFPDRVSQEAIANYLDTGGDENLLKQARSETKDIYKAGYDRALNLTPEEKQFAEQIKGYFESRLDDAQRAGILEGGIENYIHRMYEKDSSWKQSILSELRSGIFTGKPSLAKKRVYQYDFEAEKAGLKPVKSFIKRVAAYDLALNKSIADRQAVKAMMNIKMSDGRPMIDAAGLGTKTEGTPEQNPATFIQPSWKPTDEENPVNNRSDFRAFDYPALRKWKWVAQDEKGNPTFVRGDVLVHPDAMKQVKALFERSSIRSNPVGRALLNTGSAVKQTMLDISGFHPVQIGIHGAEHRSFSPVKEIDFTNPDVRGLIRGGLVVGETTGRELFDEGLSGSSLTRFIPKLGPRLQAYNDWLFNSYIPRLKVATGLHALERNRQAFPDLSEDELHHLTASQMNNAFGELNYAMMGRSQTMQDALRLTLLSPDFTEARARFAGQAATKYGGRPTRNSEGKLVMGEQGKALVLGAAAMYVTARIINKLLDDQYHFEPKNAFSVVHNGKAYGLRTVQGDLIHAATDFPSFLRNRLSPSGGRMAMEAVTGRDQFGRKRDLGQQAGDAAKTIVPISIKGLFSGREQNLAESLMNSFGLTERRDSPSEDLYKKVQKFKEKNKIRSEPGEFIYDPDKDPFRQIRLAALSGDLKGVQQEIKKEVNAGTPLRAIMKHFKDAANSPVTGSKKNDIKFAASLSDDDKKNLTAAKQERRKIFQAVNQSFSK